MALHLLEGVGPTCNTFHAHTQVLGKLAATLAPPEPQLQHAALRLTDIPFVIAMLVLVRVAMPPRAPGGARRMVDWAGAGLCAIGLTRPVFALIRQPSAG